MPPEELVGSVRAALERDPEINLHRFPVRIEWDDVREALCVAGIVEDIVALRKILRTAVRLTDFGPVVDDLRIQTGTEATDDELRTKVTRLLSTEPVFAGTHIIASGDGLPGDPGESERWIRVSVAGSCVELGGRLGSLSHRRLAEVLAWWAPGTTRVRNRILVEPPQEESDDELIDAIRIVFEKEPALDASQVHVTARDGVVTLEGGVATEAGRTIASRDCWYVPGVHAVDNQLQVLQ